MARPPVVTGFNLLKRRSLLGGISIAALGLTKASAQSALAPPPPPNPQAARLDDVVFNNARRLTIARWGDAVLPDAPNFNPNPLTIGQASTQFPYDASIAGLITPALAEDNIPRLVMVLANPAAPARMIFPGGTDNPAVAGKLQGGTILNLQYQGGRWDVVAGGYQSRRLTDGTLCQITGPAAAAIGGTVQGLLAPQAGCATPWGSVLFAEGDAAPWLSRLAGTDYGYGDPVNAPKFGWVTEVNPLDPGAIPAKRTALGRFAKSAIAAGQSHDGRAVIFIAQDDPAGMVFRFITAGTATDGTALDTGTLAVARIDQNNITWVDLPGDSASLIGCLGVAASAGGSAFDAPGGIAIGPGGVVYLACGGNKARGADQINALNPRAGDDNGHIIVLGADGGDLTARHFTGNLAIVAGNPATAALTQYTAGSNGWFRKPRTLSLDALGQLWIGTDQRGDTSQTADGIYIMQTAGPSKYLTTTAYLAPVGAAIGGVAFDAATHVNFAVVRHPGATPGASFNAPATRWPTLAPGMPPQTTIIALSGA